MTTEENSDCISALYHSIYLVKKFKRIHEIYELHEN